MKKREKQVERALNNNEKGLASGTPHYKNKGTTLIYNSHHIPRGWFKKKHCPLEMPPWQFWRKLRIPIWQVFDARLTQDSKEWRGILEKWFACKKTIDSHFLHFWREHLEMINRLYICPGYDSWSFICLLRKMLIHIV